MTKYIWITAIVIIFVLILAFKQAPREPAVSRPQSSQPGQEEGTVQDEVAPVLEADGEPLASESGNIKVDKPRAGTAVSSPLLVKGEARTFESTFQIRLKDSGGKIIKEKTATYQASDTGQFGAFGELLIFDKPETDTGTLEVFSLSAKDGTEIDKITIPLKFTQ